MMINLLKIQRPRDQVKLPREKTSLLHIYTEYDILYLSFILFLYQTTYYCHCTKPVPALSGRLIPDTFHLLS